LFLLLLLYYFLVLTYLLLLLLLFYYAYSYSIILDLFPFYSLLSLSASPFLVTLFVHPPLQIKK
jgi:hypothetical protein